MLENPAGLVPQKTPMVEEDILATAVITAEHALVHAGRVFSLTGSMTIANNTTGAIYIAPMDDVQASVTINMTNANADLTYTAVNHGTEGNSITVTHVNPSAANRALTIVTSGNDITIYLATNGSSVITSTAALVKAAINADPYASLLVTCEDESSGTGVVNAIAQTNLTGGTHLARFHLKYVSLSTTAGPITASLMENYTIDADATVLTPLNRKRGHTRVSSSIVKAKANCTVTAGTGPLTLENIHLPGTASGNSRTGANGQNYEEWPLQKGKGYVVAIPNVGISGGAVVVYNLMWYELQEH